MCYVLYLSFALYIWEQSIFYHNVLTNTTSNIYCHPNAANTLIPALMLLLCPHFFHDYKSNDVAFVFSFSLLMRLVTYLGCRSNSSNAI